MGLEYYWKRVEKSWDFSLKGRRVKFGFWGRVVMDKVVKEKSHKHLQCLSAERYQYHPLQEPKQIRVLQLAPGQPNDSLQGKLIHNPIIAESDDLDVLNWSEKYEALSYTWGSPPSSLQWPGSRNYILLDGGYLEIWPKLNTALQHLRYLDAPRTLWIDWICINQEDYVERSTQVAIMLEIYSKAEMVNIWLGPGTGITSIGMDVLQYLAQRTLHSSAPWDATPEGSFFVGLREILQQDWFSRIWVVQEAAVSQRATMMCGEDSFHWTNDPIQLRKFIRRIKFAAISPQWEQAGLSKINIGSFLQVLNLQMQHIERQSGEVVTLPPDILDIAFELRHRNASDRRDKLFAIMGLVDRSQQGSGSPFQPDYNMNVDEVFQRLLATVEI